jgi:hypothetical protein
MKKLMFTGILCVWSAAGCFSGPQGVRTPVNQVVPASAPLPGPITADAVEPTNAHHVADAIWDEMDREQQQKDPAPAKTGDGKKR